MSSFEQKVTSHAKRQENNKDKVSDRTQSIDVGIIRWVKNDYD